MECVTRIIMFITRQDANRREQSTYCRVDGGRGTTSDYEGRKSDARSKNRKESARYETVQMSMHKIKNKEL